MKGFMYALGLMALVVWAPQAYAKGVSTEKIKQAIIQESIDSYPGNCPCPYNSARNGSRCGGRSAWSRAGGYSPICYPREVTSDMIKDWKSRH